MVAARLPVTSPNSAQQASQVLFRALQITRVQHYFQFGDADMAVPLFQVYTLIPLKATKPPVAAIRSLQTKFQLAWQSTLSRGRTAGDAPSIRDPRPSVKQRS